MPTKTNLRTILLNPILTTKNCPKNTLFNNPDKDEINKHFKNSLKDSFQITTTTNLININEFF
jgi:hypothetical protein